MATVRSTKKESSKDYTDILQQLMKAVNIPSYRALSTQAAVSRWQVQQLRAGAIARMRVAVVASLADALQVSIYELFSQFGLASELSQANSALPQTDKKVKPQAADLIEDVRSQFQSEALQTLETWLTQWPTIAKRAQDRGKDLPAANILAFVKPVERLIAEWGVEAIAPVDAQVPYDPTRHQLKGGIAAPGEQVHVTRTGSLHNGKLLHRAEVKKVTPSLG